VGADGAIYEWDMSSMRRESDYVERGSDMVDVTMSADGKTHYAISGNKVVKEIQLQDGIVRRRILNSYNVNFNFHFDSSYLALERSCFRRASILHCDESFRTRLGRGIGLGPCPLPPAALDLHE